MKTKLKVFFIFVTALVVLCSCLIGINDDPTEPSTEKFEYKSTFSGPTFEEGEIVSYQFMCYVVNRTGQTLEDVEFEIKWIDSTGKTITTDTVTIPRLERGSKWPVGVIHTEETDDLEKFEDFDDVTIKYVTSSTDFSRYSTNIFVNGQVSHEVTPSYAHGTAKNYNSFDVLDPQVYVVTETSSGIIAEFGKVKDTGMLLKNGGQYEFGFALKPRAKTPSVGRYYFFVVANRSPE